MANPDYGESSHCTSVLALSRLLKMIQSQKISWQTLEGMIRHAELFSLIDV